MSFVTITPTTGEGKVTVTAKVTANAGSARSETVQIVGGYN